MEDFVAAVKVFCQDQNWKELNDYIHDSAALILKHASKIDSAIAALDPAEHTLGYLGLIIIKLSLPSFGDFELFFNQIQQLILNGCAIQLQQGVDKFCYVCNFFTKCLVEQGKAFRGIHLLSKAIIKIQQCPTELTSLHADLLQLCLVSKCMKPALKCLQTDIMSINPEVTKETKGFLLYYYYGGMIYLAVKEYEKALFFFQATVTTPTLVISHIMLESYKKYILLCILLHGKITADDIVLTYFNRQVNPVWKNRIRVFFRYVIKLLYIISHVLAFCLIDWLLYGKFSSYGSDWIEWARQNSTLAKDFNTRTFPSPGNYLLPTFGLCELYDIRLDAIRVHGNKATVVCEIESHILYQYTFVFIWVMFVLSLTVSVLGLCLLICHHAYLFIFMKYRSKHKEIYHYLTIREGEYIDFIRRKDMVLYKRILASLKESIDDQSTIPLTYTGTEIEKNNSSKERPRMRHMNSILDSDLINE